MNNNFKQLLVWQKGVDLVEQIYKVVKLLPSEEKYILTSQILRAAVSIPSNIAEGFGRFFKKEKKQFYTIAYSSSLELETQLIIINRVYPTINLKDAISLVDEVQKMLRVYIRQIET